MKKLLFDDGVVHDIDFFLNDKLFVTNSAIGEPTTANVLDGGFVYGDLSVHGDCNINVSGGSVSSGSGSYTLFAYDNSTVDITGGIVNRLQVLQNSNATIRGGSIRYGLFVYNEAVVEIYDGSIGEVERDLNASNNAKVFIYGGSIGRHLESNNYAEVSISDGSIDYDLIANDDSQVVISGGSIGRSLITNQNSQVVLIGTNFNYPLGYIPDASGTITGTLANGYPIDVPFVRKGNSAILLKAPNIVLTVTAPNGGERYLTNTPVDIEYITEGDASISTVDIEYSSDNGSSWISIATGISNTGTFQWTTPNIESENCIVRVSSSENLTVNDISDGTFIIFNCSEVNPADINSDCYVNMTDFALFAENWLWCGDRYNPLCGVE